MKAPALFERRRAEIDAQMQGVLDQPAVHDHPLYTLLRYHLGWVDEEGQPYHGPTGKAVRPALCLLACEAVGGRPSAALPAAAALEFVHNFSLVHDDIQDGDQERRHRPTVWFLWGPGQAINAGNAMWAAGNLALFAEGPAPIPMEKRLRASTYLAKACLEMIDGQSMDLQFESRMDITVDNYLTMIGLKTGALMGCSLHMGALIGTDDEHTIDALWRFGRKLGLVFQIQDDYLGVWGKSEETGKATAADIKRRKKSLPVVHALHSLQGKQKQRLYSLYKQGNLNDQDTQEVLGMMEAAGTPQFCRQMATAQRDEALKELGEAEVTGAARAEFTELADFILNRDR